MTIEGGNRFLRKTGNWQDLSSLYLTIACSRSRIVYSSRLRHSLLFARFLSEERVLGSDVVARLGLSRRRDFLEAFSSSFWVFAWFTMRLVKLATMLAEVVAVVVV